MLSQVLKTINDHAMFKPGDNVVVAVSGGPDSVALLYSLYSLKEELGIERLIVGHLNHMFRGKEAEEDALFVKDLAERLDLTTVIERANVPQIIKLTGLSPEDAARRERYSFLYSLAEKYNAKIAVGHNANDQAETVLMHLLQGSGTQGLAAMEPVRGKLTRPLLYVKRKEIESFCKENKLPIRVDPTNKKDIYFRNKIRLKLIPLLVDEYNPNLVESLMQTSEIIRAENKFLDKQVKKHLKALIEKKTSEEVALSLKGFLKQDLAVKRRIVRECYSNLKGSSQNLSFKHVEDVLKMVDASQVGSLIRLPAGIVAKKTYGRLIFKFYSEKESVEDFFYLLPVPGKLYLPPVQQVITTEIINGRKPRIDKRLLSGNSKEVLLDFDKIAGKIYVRNRRAGDRFIPYGMKGTKKLKDFFIDNKIPQEKRDLIPLVTCGKEGKNIIWVTKLRLADNYKVSKETANILKIQVENKE